MPLNINLPKIEPPKFDLPSVQMPQFNQNGLTTGIVMEAIAPGTGIITGGIVSNNPGIFDGVKNWFNNIGNSFSGNNNNQNAGGYNLDASRQSSSDNLNLYIIAGVAVIILVIGVIIYKKKRQ